MRITKAVVPAAGLGTRLLPLSKAVPKELLPLGSKPCIQWIVDELCDVGIKEILFIVNEAKVQILQHFTDDINLRRKVAGKADPVLARALDYLDYGMTFHVAVQNPLLGLGHAITFAREFTAGEPFVVALGDAVIRTRRGKPVTKRLVDSLEGSDAFAVAVRTVEDKDVSKYGIVVVDHTVDADGVAERSSDACDASDGDATYSGAGKQSTTECHCGRPMTIRSLVEKPCPDHTSSRLAISGRYVFQDVIYEALESVSPGEGGELQLTDAMNSLIQQGYRGKAVKLSPDESRYDVGNHRDYLSAAITFGLTQGPHAEEMRRHAMRILLG